MEKYTETFETWNNIASLYQEKFMKLDLYNGTYDAICNIIDKPNAKLLDIGCGPGNITNYLLSKRPDFKIFGIDIAPKMIELAKLNNPTAQFTVMDTRNIRNLNSKFDGIIGGFCLPYLSQSEAFELIFNSYELLESNGLLYLSFVEGDPKKSDYKSGSGGRVFFQYHNLKELKAQLIKSNFGSIETIKLNFKISDTKFDTHTILTAKK